MRSNSTGPYMSIIIFRFPRLALIGTLLVVLTSCASSIASKGSSLLVIPPRGSAQAKIVIYQFSDFQCTYCKLGAETVNRMIEEFPGKLKLYFKHVPLPQHEQAVPASKVALAAGAQGKFWDMHDALFENQTELGEELYLRLATQLGLDLVEFKRDRNDPYLNHQLAEDFAHAESLRITGTPTFVINGRVIRGHQKAETFREIIKKVLAE